MFRSALCIAAVTYFASFAHSASLLHSYDFNGNTVVDSVGGEDGLLLNGATVSGGALILDGVNEYVEFNTLLVPTGPTALTVGFKATLLSPDANNGIFEFISQGFSGGPGFYLGGFFGSIRLTDQFQNIGVPLPAVGQQFEYVLTSDIDGTRLFIDDQKVFISPTQLNTTAFGTNTRLGRQFDPFNEFVKMEMDELVIYEGSFGDADIDDVFVSAVPIPAAAPLMAAGIAAFSFGGRNRRFRRSRTKVIAS